MIELFAGIRAFSLASDWIGGFETIEAVEINPYCNEKMIKHYPNVPIHEDIRTYSPKSSADVIVGGSPCQGYSQAGNRKGSDDERSGLIREFLRVCDESKPKFIILENVRGIHSSGELQAFCESLHRGGYQFDVEIISAEEIGAPHQRERIFVCAYSNSIIKAARSEVLESWAEQIRSQIAIARTFGSWESSQLPDNGVSHGIPNRLSGLSAYGNAIVPQCAVVPLLRVKYLASLLQ
jgi:DNA (cytosine-5)-methyltransferase 1